MAELFDFSAFSPALTPTRPQVLTPFGPLVLEVVIGQQSSNDLPFNAFVDEEKSQIGYVFAFEAADAEILICPFKPWLPPGRWVDQSLGCGLRVASRADSVSLTYRCVWSEEVVFSGHGAANGERLQAFTWDDGKIEVSLGTLDEEGLYPDAGSKLPARWRQPIFDAGLSGIYVASIENRGIVIRPPQLMRGESCELFFAIAWGTYPEAKIDTSFAVDISYAESLRSWPGQQPFVARSLSS